MGADILNELLVRDGLDLDVRPRVNSDQHLEEDSKVSNRLYSNQRVSEDKIKRNVYYQHIPRKSGLASKMKRA